MSGLEKLPVLWKIAFTMNFVSASASIVDTHTDGTDLRVVTDVTDRHDHRNHSTRDHRCHECLTASFR